MYVFQRTAATGHQHELWADSLKMTCLAKEVGALSGCSSSLEVLMEGEILEAAAKD